MSSLHSLANLHLHPHTLANWCAAGQNLRRNVFKIHSIRFGIEHLFWNWSLGIWQALSCIGIILVKFENPCAGTKDSRKLLEFEVWDEDACSVDDFLGKATFHSKRRGGSGLGLSVSYGVGEIPLDECAAFMLQVVAVVANFYLLCFKQYPRNKSGAVLMQSRNREHRRRQNTPVVRRWPCPVRLVPDEVFEGDLKLTGALAQGKKQRRNTWPKLGWSDVSI